MAPLRRNLYPLQLWIVSHICLWTATHAKWFYTFEIQVTDSWFNSAGDGTTDTIYWRLCNGDDCGVFIKQSSGWPDNAASYVYDYPTPTYLGEINVIEIVHTGDDKLGIDWVYVCHGNGTWNGGCDTWDYGQWGTEYNGGYAGGCQVCSPSLLCL